MPLLQEVCRIDNESPTYINLWATTRYWFVNNRVGNFVNTPGPGMGNYYKAAEMWTIRGLVPPDRSRRQPVTERNAEGGGANALRPLHATFGHTSVSASTYRSEDR